MPSQILVPPASLSISETAPTAGPARPSQPRKDFCGHLCSSCPRRHTRVPTPVSSSSSRTTGSPFSSTPRPFATSYRGKREEPETESQRRAPRQQDACSHSPPCPLRGRPPSGPAHMPKPRPLASSLRWVLEKAQGKSQGRT